MFTGLIEAVGEVREVRQNPSSLSLVLETTLAPELHPGDSLAVNGVCLTVVRVTADNVYLDVGPETARVTTLAAARPGQPVNLERAMRADGRFGGHLVLGHVDGVARVQHVSRPGDATLVDLAVEGDLVELMVPHGSLTVDGVSLTVNELPTATTVQVSLIEHTLRHTTLGALTTGDRVHVEADIIGKYVRRLLETQADFRLPRT